MHNILETPEKTAILNTNYIGDLGYIYKDEPFVVPVTYFYDEEQNNIICYSGNGHKINALRKKKSVSLCVSDINSVSDWKSVLVQGKYKERSGSGAKSILHKFSLGVKKIILMKEQKELNFINQFTGKVSGNDIPVIFTIEIDDITSKRR
jgi:nitroimidazol reductase NimA-like FMN-containing flavoprotein (pyridoxamine 5'-phosphate oxidase superfamily)